MIDSHNDYKQIDDIIDAMKKMGQYDIRKQPHLINYRYAYSNSTRQQEKFKRFNDNMTLASDGDYLNNYEINTSESEITVVKVHSDDKAKPNKWDMNDVAIPGDGTHLGESPSLVNLATLVQHNEYLVPLSSWDPYYRNESDFDKKDNKEEEPSSSNQSDNLSNDNDNCSITPTIEEIDEDINNNSNCNISQLSIEPIKEQLSRRPSLAARLSKFFRKHCKKSKTLPLPLESCQLGSDAPKRGE